MARYTGAVCRQCRREGQKLFLKGERCYSDKCAFARRSFVPGQHGAGQVRKKVSEYGLQLKEKQKVKFVYGIMERQFRSYYEKAARMKGNTGDELMTLLERRLDNVVYRLGFAATRREARQLVSHGHFTVNGQRVDIPSYLVSLNDVIAVCEKSASNNRFKKLKEDDAFVAAPKWLERDKNNLQGKVVAMPTKEDIDFEIAENLIVELYSK